MTDFEARLQMRLDMLEDAKRHLAIHKEGYRNSLKWVHVDRALGNYDNVRNDLQDAEQHRRMCFLWQKQVARAQRHIRRLSNAN